jgi:serine protease
MNKVFRFKKHLAIMTFIVVAAAFCVILSAVAEKTPLPQEEGLITVSSGVQGTGLKTRAAGSGRYYIVFKNKPAITDENNVKSKGANIRHKFDLIPAYSAEIPNDTVLSSIKSDTNVAYVEEVSQVFAFADIIPWGVQAVNAPLVWDTVTGNGINVCVLDTGIDYTHPDLNDNYGGGYDFVNNDADPWDDHGHGTHCSGTIAAEANGFGVVGVAYNAALYSCKVLNQEGVGYSDDILAGIEWAVNNGMHIASLSLGGGGYSTIEERAYQAAYDAGLLIVCASGNDGVSVIDYPAKYVSNIAVGSVNQALVRSTFSQYGSELELVAPGEFVLSTVPVGTGSETSVTEGSTTYEADGMEYAAYTDDDGFTATAFYCGLGETPADFPAGVSGNIALIQRGNISFADKTTNAMNAGAIAVIIYNNLPGSFLGTLGTPGGWVPVVSMSNEDGETLRSLGTPTVTLIYKAGDYDYNQGTSMACPHVVGVAALVMEANDELTNVQVRDIMNGTAVDLGAAGWDPEYGYGLVNAEDAVEEAVNQEVYLFISAVKMDLVWLNKRHVRALAYVSIIDTNGDPVPGAVVYGEWGGCVSGEDKAETGNNGVAVLQSPIYDNAAQITPARPCFIVRIRDIYHLTIPYAPKLNKVKPGGRICL